MKIVHVIPTLNKGGAERLVLDVCNELQEMGHEVHLVIFRNENAYTFLSKSINLHVIPSEFIPSITGKPKINIEGLQKFLSDFQADIVHSHLFESEMVLNQIRLNRAKFFFHLHDNVPQLKKWSINTLSSKRALANYFERKLILKSMKARKTSLIAISEDSYQFAKDNLPSQLPIHQLSNAINTVRFTSGNQERCENDIVMIGSFVPKKDHKLAIEVIYELKNQGINTRLHLLGDGPLRQELEQFVIDLGLSQSIIFHGNVDYPETILKESSLYLHTAKYEPFGLVLLEAMAAGLPVVCTDGKGNRGLIENGKNGFLTESRSASELARLITLVICNKEKLERMRVDAQKFATQFDIKPYCVSLIKLYDK